MLQCGRRPPEGGFLPGVDRAPGGGVGSEGGDLLMEEAIEFGQPLSGDGRYAELRPSFRVDPQVGFVRHEQEPLMREKGGTKEGIGFRKLRCGGQMDDDVRGAQRFLRPSDSFGLHRVLGAPMARRVDEADREAADLAEGFDRVPRRSGVGGDDRPVLAQDRVEEARLTDIRAAGENDDDPLAEQPTGGCGAGQGDELVPQPVDSAEHSRPDLRSDILLRKIEEGFPMGDELQKEAPSFRELTAEPTLFPLLGGRQAAQAAGVNEIGDRLGLGQVELAMEKGALGELSGKGCAGAEGEIGGEDPIDQERIPVAGDFDHLFPGIRARLPPVEEDDVVQPLHAVPELAMGGLLGLPQDRLPQQQIGDLPGPRTADADNGQGGRRGRGGQGGNGVIHRSFLAAMWDFSPPLSSFSFDGKRRTRKLVRHSRREYDGGSRVMASELFEGQEFRSERQGVFVRVLLERKRDCLLDYAVPERLAGRIGIGSHVRVPLRRTQATGWVIDFPARPAVEGVRELTAISEEAFHLPRVLLQLAEWAAGYYCAPLAATLACILPAPVRGARTQERLLVRSLPEPREEDLDRLGCSSREKQAWLQLRALGPTWLTRLCAATGIGPQVWKRLAKRGLVDLRKVERSRHPLGPSPPQEGEMPVLTGDQAAACETVRGAIRQTGFAPFLLFGVTGSGKTEVYLRSVEEALAQGRSALILVPEIALTPQLVEQVQRRFGDLPGKVALWHSRLSAGERYDQWKDVCSGRARIVVGARSAVFAPLRGLGLIVVDEEHEPAYKQGETPRYHARDVAVMRARREGIPVVLGSACPSLESYANALAGKYRLLELSARVENRSLPLVRVVDLRGRGKRRKTAAAESPWLSRELREELAERLAGRRQAILYVNRRGYARVLQCADCGGVKECPHCSVALTYHRTGGNLRCHFCGHLEPYPRECSACHGLRFEALGTGTERVVEAVERAFPSARILRMDSDSMARKGALPEALRAFAERRFDILVGTQMVAKGLHFPGVTLVGVVQIDGLLHMPDFRSAERAFQQLLQVAGRSGRGETRGSVLIQTRCPVHPAIQFARHHDYRGFAEQDLEFRAAFGYPPAARLLLLVWKSPNEALCRQTAEFEAGEIRRRLAALAEPGEVLPAPIARLQGVFRYQLLLKTQRMGEAARLLRQWIEARGCRAAIDLAVDVDPVDFL